MEKIPAPAKFDSRGNAAEQWRAFKQSFTLYLKATNTARAPSDRQVALLLTVGGSSLLDIYNTLDFGESTAERPNPEFNYAHVISLLDAHFLPKHNELYSRYVFRTRMQRVEEQFDSFVTDLKLKAHDCGFGNEREKMIRDQIVCGIYDEKARADILKLEDPTLEKVEKVCRAHEATGIQMQAFKEGTSNSSDSVHAVKKFVHRTNAKTSKFAKGMPQKSTVPKCRYCGGGHERKREACPAWKQTCSKCKKQNHFAAVCKSSKVVAGLAVDSDDETILAIQSSQPSSIHTFLTVNGKSVKFQVDSGAAVDVIPAKHVNAQQIEPCKTTLRTWNGSKVRCWGKAQLEVTTANGQ